VFAVGLVFLSKAKLLIGYNEIYLEYGKPFVWLGIGFIVYSTVLLVVSFLPRIPRNSELKQKNNNFK
jgi:hypothetical protein